MTLMIPDRYKSYSLVSIDPGITYMGISVFRLVNDNITYIDSYTIRPSSMKTYVNCNTDMVTQRFISLNKIKNFIETLVREEQPSVVVSEGTFFNPLSPSAYGSLLEIISYVNLGVSEVSNNIHFSVMPPMLVKKNISSEKIKSKASVKEALMMKPSIIDNLVVNIETLDEHAIDSIAVGYSYLVLSSNVR